MGPEEFGSGEREVIIDTLYTNEPVIDDDILFDCNFRTNKSKLLNLRYSHTPVSYVESLIHILSTAPVT